MIGIVSIAKRVHEQAVERDGEKSRLMFQLLYIVLLNTPKHQSFCYSTQ